MSLFRQHLDKRVLIFDGAMGTAIHNYDLDCQKDYLGKENCSEMLVKTRPDVVQAIHESYLAVGADAVETNTFGANKLVLEDFDMVDLTYQINKDAAQIARAACEKHHTGDKPRFVIGSLGPGTKLITLGNTHWDAMFDSYHQQVLGLIDGGADVLLIETAQDLLQVKCAINACLAALSDKKRTPEDIPIMVQVTIETTGTMLVGTQISAAANSLAPFPILSLGMNCATGPTEMGEHVRWLSKHWDRHISILPNAGLPALIEGQTVYPLQPQAFAKAIEHFVKVNGVSIVGGCCGTTQEHIAQVVQAVGDVTQPQHTRTIEKEKPGCSSLYSVTDYRQDTSILNVGERTNASGSRKFKQLLEAEDWDAMVSLARNQAREGSHVIDVNVDYAGRDNAKDMATVVSQFVQQVNAPLMLDSTQIATLEAGLKQAGGKCLINSANLEEGEEKFAQMCTLAKTYGAGLVVGCIDEDPQEAMARTADRKITIAKRMVKLATQKHGLAIQDIMIDPLVLPISTGMDKDRRSALETIQGTRQIADQLPQCQITAGLSNVSFGLKPAARQVLNSVFLYELIQAGLTSAILHVSKILPRNKIADAQWQAAYQLIYNQRDKNKATLADGSQTDDPLQIFIDLFPDGAVAQADKQVLADLPLEEKLQKHIVDGEKQDLIQTLDEAREKYAPLEIVNDHLLAGMKVVGELFGSGQMQLPFVLQSAQVMKMAVSHLEQFMAKEEGQAKGSIVLATVRGDVHDIGKNLVDIILSNNGYTVHNIGIKQPIADIIKSWREHQPNAIGLSGLLVKSVLVMQDNLIELNDQKIDVPILLGGAALTRQYCENDLRSSYNGQVYYGKDAFEGLRIMDLLSTGKQALLSTEIKERQEKRAKTQAKIDQTSKKQGGTGGAATLTKTVSDVAKDIDVPQAPFYGDQLVAQIPLEQIYPYLNTVALFKGQWQYKKGKLTDQQYATQLEEQIIPVLDKLKQQAQAQNTLVPQVVYGYYPCNSQGNDLIIYDAKDHDKEIQRYTFPRQLGKKSLCIADFFKAVDTNQKDIIAFTCVTVGQTVSKIAKQLFESDQYTDYLHLHGFGVEMAEALAELWHKRIRQELGFENQDSADVRKLFTQHYRGSRYSFGYPACPEMSDQEKLFALLKPDRIGCKLTENWQIDPEQSTSAIIVHHPQAKYFSA